MEHVPTQCFEPLDAVVTQVTFDGKDSEPKVLHYFAIQGLGELPRLMLEYTQTPYSSVMYFGNGEYKDFAPYKQLPVYQGSELGDQYLAQSGAICRHIARENNCYGTCGASIGASIAIQDMVFEAGKDLLSGKGLLHEKEQPQEKITNIFNNFKKLADEDKCFTGRNPGFGEIGVFYVLYQYNEIKPEVFDGYEFLKSFIVKVKEIPQIKSYLSSARFLPLTENEQGREHKGLEGYKYLKPLNPEVIATKYVKN